jgi:protocatechuate 3,4-dioxygenase beta subunit
MPFIKKDEYILAQSANKALNADNQEVRIDLVLQKNEDSQKGMLFGSVSDQLGNAIPYAVVVLMDDKYNPISHSLTGQDGTYLLSGIEPGKAYSVYASAPGYGLAQSDNLSISPQQEIEINFSLVYNAASFLSCIAGTVVDEKGQPVPEATLRLALQGSQNDAFYSQTGTNEAGLFVFTELPMGSYRLKASAQGYQPCFESIHIPKQGIILNPTLTLHSELIKEKGIITGRITDDNMEPLADADVILYRIDKDGRQTPIASAKTLNNGVYLFVNQPEGEYAIKSCKAYRLEG